MVIEIQHGMFLALLGFNSKQIGNEKMDDSFYGSTINESNRFG